MSAEADAHDAVPSTVTMSSTVPATAATATEDNTATTTSTAVKKKAEANSYYYWHSHEKERAKVGDVAPMPTPVLVKKDDTAATLPRALVEVPVSKYSWADSETHVTVYIDMVSDDKAAGETVDEASVSVTFTKHSCDVSFVTRTGGASSSSSGHSSGGGDDNAGAVADTSSSTRQQQQQQRRRRLVLPLAKKIDAKASSYKLRMPAARLVLRLTKASPGTWFDLVRDAHKTPHADSSSSSSASDSDEEDTTAADTQTSSAPATASAAADDVEDDVKAA